VQIKSLAALAAMVALVCAPTAASATSIVPYAVAGSTSTLLWGVNDAGVLVGSYDGGGFIDDHGVITTVNLAGSPGYVAGISNDGVAVGSDGTTSFFYQGGVLTPFAIAGEDQTLLRAISSNGRYAAGIAYDADGNTEGFVLDRVSNQISTLAPPAGLSVVVLQGVNDDGVAVGNVTGAGGSMLFDSVSGTATYFQALDGLVKVRARAFDDAGDIGGWGFNADGKWVGFLDTAAGDVTLFDLGSNSTVIYGLNNAGLAVGSWENDDGIDHSFVINLTAVPEPSTLVLMALGLAAIAVRRHRRNG